MVNDGLELSTICRQLKLESSDGKKYLTDCVDTETAFRIVESVPSPKAEPMKRWLAKTGFEKRMRGIVIREELTNEWKNRGIKKDLDYKILTSEILKSTFGIRKKFSSEIMLKFCYNN